MKNQNKTMFIGVSLYGALLVLLVFIFGNSLLKSEISHSSSETITQMLTASQGERALLLEYLFRKLAHIIEFASLGALIMFLKIFYARTGKFVSVWLCCFSVLAVGVLDEFLQSFSNRSSSVSDVLLDFGGGLLGITFAVIGKKIWKHITHKQIGGNGCE